MKQAGWFAAATLSAALVGGLMVAPVAPAAASAGPGIITTLAGGPGRGTRWNTSQGPESVATGPGGAVYVADNGGEVREFTGTSVSETVTAGNGAIEIDNRVRNGVPATRASLANPDGVVIDSAGNEVIADSGANRVRVVAAATGTFYGRPMTAGDIYTIAGSGTSNFGNPGDGGPATAAQLYDPVAVALDGGGNVLIADLFDYRVRVVAVHSGTFYGQSMTAGDIYTIAGNGTDGYSGDGGPATSAELEPYGLAVDSAGNVLITDSAGDRIRVVAARSGTFYGQAMAAGNIYTIAGNGTFGYSGDGGPATAAELKNPEGVASDGAGNVLIADTSNHRVRVVAARSGTFYGRAMTAGDIYTVAGSSRIHYGGDGGPATSAGLMDPAGVTVDTAGNLLIADTEDGRVRVVAPRSGTFYRKQMTAGDIYTVAGNGFSESSGSGARAVNAELAGPGGVAVSGSGNYVMSGGERVWVTAARSGTFFGQSMTAGNIYAIAGDGKYGFWGDRGPATSAALGGPEGVAVDAAGNVLIADQGNNRIRMVANRSGSSYGRAMIAGHIYTVAGGGSSSADGVPATTAVIVAPSTVAVDAAGNLLIGDFGAQVRVVAARSGTFYGQAMTAGDIYTIAGTGASGYSGDGGPATSAELADPDGLAVDGAGNVVIADYYSDRIRVVAAASGTFYGQAMTAGDIYTVAGGGSSSGDGVPATSVGLDQPEGLAVDGSGNIVITDGVIRVVADASGTFYGQAMTTGDIYTIAGGGTGPLGDDGPATAASLFNPSAVAVDGAGDVVIADFGDGRIRLVSE